MIRFRVNIRDNNRIPEVRRALQEFGSYALKVGIFSDEDSSETSYVMIGRVHEFGVTITRGTGTIVIPERSFIRSTFDENNDKWVAFLKRQARQVAQLTLPPKVAWERLGALIVADIQEQITDISSPPNAPSTILKKGSSNPLIDTGGLRQRITYRVVSK